MEWMLLGALEREEWIRLMGGWGQSNEPLLMGEVMGWRQ